MAASWRRSPTVHIFDLQHLRPGDIVLERTSGTAALLVRAAERGRYSHSLLYLGGTDFMESTKSGVRVISFLRFIVKRADHVHVLRHTNPAAGAAAALQARNLAHKRYDLGGAIRTKVGGQRRDPAALFCSQLVAVAYEKAGHPLCDQSSAEGMTPNGLLRTCPDLAPVSPVPLTSMLRSEVPKNFLNRDKAYEGSAPDRELVASQAVYGELTPLLVDIVPQPGNLTELIAWMMQTGEPRWRPIADRLLDALERHEYFDLANEPLKHSEDKIDGGNAPPAMLLESWRAAADRIAQEGLGYEALNRVRPHPLWERYAKMHQANAARLRKLYAEAAARS